MFKTVRSDDKWHTLEDKRSRVVVCMPAYNEEKYVASTVLKCRKYLKNIYVVDDCSSDRTGIMAKMAGAKVVRLDVSPFLHFGVF